MGFLEFALPPIALHASTQTNNRGFEKVRFLEAAGFSQIVLARELSLEQIREIAAGTAATLEFFVHGALCVSYSGQCYLSHARTGRSANRGECSQPCRLPYTLEDSDGRVIACERHLLSLKDNNQSANLRDLADAGIRAFKIEGRLKDMSYVKNVTAHYRRLLDAIIEEVPEYRASSAGRCAYTFEPQPEKSFNRGFTDYFVRDRHDDIGAFDSPKFVGEPVGKVVAVGQQHIDVENTPHIHNGDGLAFFNAVRELAGVRINRVEGKRLLLAEAVPGLTAGVILYRNHDQEFERLLEKKSAERKIPVCMELGETAEGFVLRMADGGGIAVTASLPHAREMAQNPERVDAAIREQLGKLGNTLFVAEEISLKLSALWFIPVSALNALRRQAVEQLENARFVAYRRQPRTSAVEPLVPYPQTELGYLGNVLNGKARAFYTRHGVTRIEDAYECNREMGEVLLMLTKHCLRYSFNLCPKQVPGIRPDPMTLLHGSEKLTLCFDCKLCEMHVIGRLKQNASAPVVHRFVRKA